tara:strand:- start:71 stop:322 length:252 start_codon:yes stop_codon:yes gene_type:complete
MIKLRIKTVSKYFLCAALLTLCSCEYDIVNVKELREQSYFEGQKDALNGDVRIKKNIDSCWIWSKSPWNSGVAPTFIPSFECK